MFGLPANLLAKRGFHNFLVDWQTLANAAMTTVDTKRP
jgi:hypothetical protein